MHILGLIPAREGSKGIPHKNRRLLARKPLIEYTFASALESQHLTRIVLTTDDPQIAALGRAAGIDVPFSRPKKLSEDHSPILDAIHHALDWLATHEDYRPDIIILLQPTTPLRRGQHIDEAITLLRESNLDSVVSVNQLPAHYHPRWQFLIEDQMLKVFTGEPLSAIVTRRQELPPTYTRNGAIYAFTRQTLELTNTIYGERCGAYEMSPLESIIFDTWEDWKLAEAHLGKS